MTQYPLLLSRDVAGVNQSGHVPKVLADVKQIDDLDSDALGRIRRPEPVTAVGGDRRRPHRHLDVFQRAQTADLFIDFHKGAAPFPLLAELGDFLLAFHTNEGVGSASLMVLPCTW